MRSKQDKNKGGRGKNRKNSKVRQKKIQEVTDEK
jgi:ribosomal protein S30